MFFLGHPVCFHSTKQMDRIDGVGMDIIDGVEMDRIDDVGIDRIEGVGIDRICMIYLHNAKKIMFRCSSVSDITKKVGKLSYRFLCFQ